MRHIGLFAVIVMTAMVLAASPEPQTPPARGAAAPAPAQTYAGLTSEPVVRIGLGVDAAAVTVRSDQPFTIDRQRTRSAKFSTALTVPAAAAGPMPKSSLQARTLVELDEGVVLLLPQAAKIRIEPGAARLEANAKSYRGIIEVVVSPRNTFTVINELPLEEYLLGVVPNELGPVTYNQLEALKAQAVAARTYIVRNLGQYKRDGYDICNTDNCQVYGGASTEHPLSNQAVTETRGVIAIYGGRPINALYSSTCGGRTESSENIFEEKVPYLTSTSCEFKHPEPHAFASGQFIEDFEDAVLRVARVTDFATLRRFFGMTGAGATPPAWRAGAQAELAKYVRETFYPGIKTYSDLEFLAEQGILSTNRDVPLKSILYRLIEKKSAFEWQQGVLTEWDGQTLKFLIGGTPRSFKLSAQAPIFARIGDDRVAMKEGGWIGGELFDFRAVADTIQFAVYRRNFVNPSADRYSRLATWQAHKTRQELDTAFQPLGTGATKGIRVLQRGPSERPVQTEVSGTRAVQVVRALRLRSLLGLRDSLFYFDEERNAQGELLGISFYGSGWGHGVGMCQIGAFGMALEGAGYEQILKKYYQGIDIAKAYK